MDIISRLPGCTGQAADAVSAHTQVKMEDASTLLKNSKVRMSRYLDTSTQAQIAQIMVQYGRPSRSSRAESVRSSSGRTVMGKAIWESSIGIRLGKRFEMGMFICRPSKRAIPISVCGRYQTGRQKRKHRNDLEISHDLGQRTSFLTTKI